MDNKSGVKYTAEHPFEGKGECIALKPILILRKHGLDFLQGKLNTLQSIPLPVSIKGAAKLMCPKSGGWHLLVSAAQEGQLKICS